MTTFSQWLLFGFLLLGCSSGSAEATEAEELFRDRTELACRKQSECCGGTGSPSARFNACMEAQDDARHALQTTEDELALAIKNDNATVSMSVAGQCFAEIAALDCTGWARVLTGAVPHSCRLVIEGKLVEGDPCENHYECASQNCAEDASGARICLPRVAARVPCMDAECAGICAINPSAVELFSR